MKIVYQINEADLRDVIAALDQIDAGSRPEVVRREVKLSLGDMRTATLAFVRSQAPTLSTKAIGRKLRVRMTGGETAGDLIVVGGTIPLIEYGAIQTPSGVSVSVKDFPSAVRHAFIATMPSGHRGVYIRESGEQFGGRFRPGGKGFRKSRGAVGRAGIRIAQSSGLVGRLPIRELRGPGIADLFRAGAPAVQELGIKRLRERLVARLGFGGSATAGGAA
jgi:hypothetical protein